MSLCFVHSVGETVTSRRVGSGAEAIPGSKGASPVLYFGASLGASVAVPQSLAKVAAANPWLAEKRSRVWMSSLSR
jgi:hypothetical protein